MCCAPNTNLNHCPITQIFLSVCLFVCVLTILFEANQLVEHSNWMDTHHPSIQFHYLKEKKRKT